MKIINLIYMKTLLTITLIAVSALIANAQSGWYAAFTGDTVVLNVSGQNGTIQWQQSTDSLTWTDISGAITTPYELITTSSATGKRFFRAEITDALCPNATPFYSSIICYKVLTSTTQVIVGDWFHGGIVFYIDGTGQGLVAPQTDQSTSVKWGCYATSIPGATSTTNGQANTTAILAGCATRPIAASICDDLVHNGYNDWYLPAIDQLSYLRQQMVLVGGFTASYYWSSSQNNDIFAWIQSFSSLIQNYGAKNDNHYLRCVRSFSTIDNITKTFSYTTATNQPVTAVITTQPISQNKCYGSGLTLSVTATGTAPVSYQWKKDGVDITGATSNIFTKSGLTLADEGIYTCEVTNLCRSIISEEAELKVIQLLINAGDDVAFCNDTAYHLLSTASTNHAEFGALLYSWSPSTGLSNTTILNPTAQPTINTTYTLTITDPTGCTVSDTITLSSNTPVSITTQPLSYNKCLNDSITFSTAVSGTSPIIYLWKKDGNEISGAIANTYSLSGLQLSDEAVYTCEVTNFCRTVGSDSAELKVIQLIIDAGIDQVLCGNQFATINSVYTTNHPSESGTVSYLWSPATGLSSTDTCSPVASPLVTTDYIVIVTDQINCSDTDTVNVLVQSAFQDEEICLVSVDTITWKNKIMWEKTSGNGTHSFNIYKETSYNLYDSIGNVLYNDPCFFIDIGSVPESHGDKYKIAVIDTCGNKSALSYYHKTMNLVISSFGSTMGLSWTAYEDESGLYHPGKYYIYRGTQPDNMQLLDSISASFISYNDNNVFDLYYYIIGVLKPGGCNVNKSTDISYSNKRDNSTFVGIYNSEITQGTIIISPNPMSTSATLTIPNFEIRNPKSEKAGSDFVLRISDLTGKVVRNILIDELLNLQITPSLNLQIKIERGDLKPGIYFVELKADRIFRGKLIVE